MSQVTHYRNRQFSRVMNLKYKSKVKKLNRQIKNLVFENASLCDVVVHIQADLFMAREERRYLIRRLMRYEGVESFEEINDSMEKNEYDKKQMMTYRDLPKATNIPKKRGPRKRSQQYVLGNIDETSHSINRVLNSEIPNNSLKPVYPLNLYSILIHSPGEVIPSNSNFHTENWIYPVGYVATRIYAHPKDPLRKCVYTCKILNNAGIPQFQIIPDNDLDNVFFGETANICHQALLETLQRILSDVVKLPLNIQGEKFFGLSHPRVKSLIQMDIGFKECINFKAFPSNEHNMSEEPDPTMSFDALQSLIATSTSYHTMPVVKEEPPDELLHL